ncbi:hypothetical protein [Salinibacillus xinjiangensis]|uniref:Uncharacterized protein n=1 Tax=Salinibacillus xinjiangensis TaxID=1229268 RepID=A0A6G1X9K0_9BACI|nr:hypothetical protein [Salinibacillus xinjiangensis]MRG87550.1 hypothetical protein [Salinibacillus xinjiangensis]
MKAFLNKHYHWLFLIVVSISFILSLVNFDPSTKGIVAIIFGGIGFLGVVYLVVRIEVQNRKNG